MSYVKRAFSFRPAIFKTAEVVHNLLQFIMRSGFVNRLDEQFPANIKRRNEKLAS